MKYPHSIPLWHPNGEPFPGGTPSRVVLSSVDTKWNDVVVEQHHFHSSELPDVMYKRHLICINIGHSFTREFEKDRRFHRVQRARGAITFFPSHQPFSGRLKAEGGGFANFLLLALNPAFVSRVAEGLEFDADRIELTGHAKLRSRAHDDVIRVYGLAGNVIETHALSAFLLIQVMFFR